MAASITITSATLTMIPSVPIPIATARYRLTSDEDIDENYIIVPQSSSIALSGAIVPVIYVPGLSNGTSYTFQIETECDTQTFEFTTPASACVDLTSVAYTI